MFTNRTLDRLDAMLDAAIAGDFRESDYDETKLSRLEAKWKQYLATASMSRANLERERENIKSLVSDISHQTKTPMTNIRLYAELLSERLADEENLRLLGELVRQTEKLEFLIQALTKLSRLEGGLVTVAPKQERIGALLAGAVAELLPKAERKHISVRNTYEGDAAAFFDRKWTAEALFNILDNAVKYSACGSTVTVSVMEYEMYAAICVRDEGMGISEEEIPKLFERFYRGSQADGQEGVGIGLYLAREILRKENGYIRVNSKCGEGTEFRLFLQKYES